MGPTLPKAAVGSEAVRRGAEVAAAALAVLVVGVAAPSAVGRASAQPPVSRRRGPDRPGRRASWPASTPQVDQLQAALAQADAVLATAQASVDAIRQDATSREQLQAQLVGQARAYAIQRYMYGSADSRDLLAFLSALNKPADDAVWGLATLEVSSEAALDQAQQVAKARAAVADRLAQAESDVAPADDGPRPHEPRSWTPRPRSATEVATRFDGVVRELGQATVNGMSTVAYDAYRKAEATLAAEQPACGLRWELLAAIGKTESNHGVGRLDVFGNSLVRHHRHPDRRRHRRRRARRRLRAGTTRSARCSSSPPPGSKLGHRRQRRRQGRSREHRRRRHGGRPLPVPGRRRPHPAAPRPA